MNPFCSIFSQLLKHFSRVDFLKPVKEAKRHAQVSPIGASLWTCTFVYWAGLLP
jgi:hypothetical protein